jgi:hypothetical protein
MLAIGLASRCTSTHMATDLRYPIGDIPRPEALTPERRTEAIDVIATLPVRMREAVYGLADPQLDTPYRPGGWTVRQVVHHVADSHLNAFIRMKLALTEDCPTITPYDEKTWAELADVTLPVEISLKLLDSLHARWTAIYRTLTPAHFSRTFLHPELEGPQMLDRQLQSYAWHSRHHVAHITRLREREGW